MGLKGYQVLNLKVVMQYNMIHWGLSKKKKWYIEKTFTQNTEELFLPNNLHYLDGEDKGVS